MVKDGEDGIVSLARKSTASLVFVWGIVELVGDVGDMVEGTCLCRLRGACESVCCLCLRSVWRAV
jgi:hypothetical protein